MEKKTRKIYIVLSQTGTILSRIIKLYTKAEYSHVSLALDKDLNEMYSFGRLNPYNPFIGGFVQEGINFGTFKRFKNTLTEIYSLEITENQYQIIKSEIENIKSHKKNYKFNFVGLVFAGINYRLKRKNAFYCAEFVKYLVDEAEIELELPEVIKPIDFKKIENIEILYMGILRNYN